MNIMQIAESFLFTVSAALYFPVTLALALLVLYILVLCGRLLREYLERRRGHRYAIAAYQSALSELLPSVPATHRELEITRLLQQHERQMIKTGQSARFIVRAAPGIGLMGTLIPMGVALSSLSEGDMSLMSAQMVHAFNAVVVGLGASVIAYAIALVRESWLRADSDEIRYLTEQSVILGKVPDSSNASATGQLGGELS